MPFADPRARLEHILEAIREIEGFTAGRRGSGSFGNGEGSVGPEVMHQASGAPVRSGCEERTTPHLR